MENFIRYYRVLFSYWANSLLYALSKVPVVGKYFFSKFFDKYNLKKIFGVMGFFIRSFMTIIFEVIKGAVILIYIPNFILGSKGIIINDNKPLLATIFIIAILLGSLLDISYIFASSIEDNLFLNNFSLDENMYYKNKFIKNFILRLIANTILIYFIFKNLKYLFILITLYILMDLLNLFINAKYMEKHEKYINYKIRALFKYSIYLITGLLLFFNKLIYFNLDKFNSLFLTIIIFFSIFLSYKIFMKILNFKDYKKVKRNFSNNFKISVSVKSEGFYEDTESNDKDYTATKNIKFLDENRDKSYFKYIEVAFIERFKKVIGRSIKSQLISTLLLFILITLLLKLKIFTIDTNNPLKYTPFILSFIIGLGYSENYLKLCFRNYDMPFMYQRLFNKRGLKNQIIRRTMFILKTALVNLFFMTLILLSFIYINRINVSINEIIDFIIVYTLTFLTFEIHNIIVYYIMEPYNIDLTSFNGKYLIANRIKSILVGILLFYRANLLILKGPIIIIFCMYLILFFITINIAPKTFKLRV